MKIVIHLLFTESETMGFQRFAGALKADWMKVAISAPILVR
jgi:hypothetical protein